MISFLHSGDIGDIIYSLPTVKALGGGILYLDVTGGESDPYVQENLKNLYRKSLKFNEQSFNFLKPLLENQSYIKSVEVWNGQKVDYNLNQFRDRYNKTQAGSTENLVETHLITFKKSPFYGIDPWLNVVPNTNYNDRIIINRNERYHSNLVMWVTQAENIHKNGLFVGMPYEHEAFQRIIENKVDYIPVKNALDLAQIIAGSGKFMGNQSAPLAIAIGLGVQCVVENFTQSPNCIFKRKNLIYQ